jgi:hypothetical protein
MASAPYAPPAGANGGRVVVTQERAKELFVRAGMSYYDRAKEAGMTLTAWLEAQDPSPAYKDGLDAYERQLMMANIRTQGDDHTYWADEMDAWSRSPAHKALFPEWARRQWNKSRLPQQRDVSYNLADYAEGTASRPYADDLMIRYTNLDPAVPLAELVAKTTPIRGNAYRSTRLTHTAAQKRMVRVAEGAPIPRVKLVTSEDTVRFGKFGRSLETTYEQVRNQRIDVIGLHIQLMSIQTQVDEVAAVIDVIVNGDGNAGTAATVYAMTTLDPNAVIGEPIPLEAWLAFRQKFKNPYRLGVVLVRDNVEIQLRTLNVGTANIPYAVFSSAAMLGGFTPINDRLGDGVRIGVTDDAPANQIVGLDERFAIERVIEIGSDIQEMARFIENQTNLMTMTLSEGFASWQIGEGIVGILDLAA